MAFTRVQNKDYSSEAELLKTLGHPLRLKIVAGLLAGSCCVNEMSECLGVAQSTISQHLSILRAKGIVEGTRKGTTITYAVVHPLVQRLVGQGMLSGR